MVALEEWFLTPTERGNGATRIDHGASARGWSEGNQVELLVHGCAYFTRLLRESAALGPRDWLYFTDWEGDGDERLTSSGPDVAGWLAALAARGVHVRGLLWRSHPRQLGLGEQPNMALAEAVNRAGGEVLLDERVRRGGSHHQKLIVFRREHGASRDVAFVGGIDLAHGRRDDDRHLGDEQPLDFAAEYGPRPPWHDAQLEIRGPAVAALADTFRERWEDPTPLDHRNPLRRLAQARTGQPRRPDPLPPRRAEPPSVGPHAVQVLRTYAAKRPRAAFAPAGERSIARAYLKAFRRARRLVYIEDQFFWSNRAADELAALMRRRPSLHVIVVVPRFPDRDGAITSRSARIARQDALHRLRRADTERVLVCDLENDAGTPVYVHAKVCVIDDVWAMVGSDNVNLRSWSHDSELSCSVIDETLDPREPRDPAGLGEGARVFARDARLRLWREHLGRADDDDGDLLDPDRGFAAFRDAARELDEWVGGGRVGPRPPGRVRRHRPRTVPTHEAWWARAVSRMIDDPDGRPRALRRNDDY
jgi:phosphatidylserine/phosphatidylglycerophosphate/cardiolipin synthase-like enzyme